jgi:hypothetical protein
LSTHVCRLPGSISGSCSASLEPNPDSKIYRTLSSARLRWDRRGNLATTSASLRYWNSARQRYCRQLVRYRKTLASLPTRSPSQQPRPARKAGFSTFENDCGRETDCLLEGDGFELPVPRTTPGFWPISTRTTRRDRCRKKGVRIRQLLVFAALGREWWALTTTNSGAPVMSQVRTRLAAGESRIRTLGPAVKGTAVGRRATSVSARSSTSSGRANRESDQRVRIPPLPRGVQCELGFLGRSPSIAVGRTASRLRAI